MKELKTELTEEGLLSYLPSEAIVAAFDASPGNEIKSGKFMSPESSAALAANTFGYFIDKPEQLPVLPGTESMGWPASFVTVEHTAPFPWWPRGRHPWLDAFVETNTHIIGIESKRYEPFRSKSKGSFSEAYWRPVWGDNMKRYEAMRDQISRGDIVYERLDAAQLVKHAFGLRTEGERTGKLPCLVYLYAEPAKWSDGRAVDPMKNKQHQSEAASFADAVAGDDVQYVSLSYLTLLDGLAATDDTALSAHVAAIRHHFAP